jgi:hypothetical protein
MPGEEGVLEIRPAYSAQEFGEFVTEVGRQQKGGKNGPKKPVDRKPSKRKTTLARSKK